jgi:putative ABC transport system permease protein
MPGVSLPFVMAASLQISAHSLSGEAPGGQKQFRNMLLSNLMTALRALRTHRLRSALTTLGIIIGVAAVVAMNAIGSGARERVAEQIRSLGANLISINPGSSLMTSVRLSKASGSSSASNSSSGVPSAAELQSPRLSEDDAAAIKNEVSGVVAVAPLLYARTAFTVGGSNWMGNMRGVTPNYFVAREWGVSAGREMTPEDDRRAEKVVLLGTTMREKLFEDEDPVGATVRIRDVPFTVIGLLDHKGQDVWGDDQDDVALAPLHTVRRQFLGISPASPKMVHNITVKFADGASAEDIMDSVRDLLRQRHRLQPGQEQTFLVSNLAEAAGVEQMATRTMSLLLAAVASVALVVGGIGIMNIMLVTVAERTHEIGLRLAVGARPRDILLQFLIEATLLALLGGILGAVVGIFLSAVIAQLAGWPAIVSIKSLVLAMAFAGAIGCFFGYHPARKAARMDPIDALRYE